MKKGTAITALIMVTLIAASGGAASAQQLSASTSAETSIGGLGTGLNSMVRSILNDEPKASPAPAAQPAAQMMMIEADAQTRSGGDSNARNMNAGTANTAFTMQAAAQTEADVSEFIRSILKNDANVQSVDASDSHVRLTYRTNGTVFRFLKVTIPVTGEVYVSGKTTVTYPWYATMAGLKSDIRTRFTERLEFTASESIPPETQIQLISTMHAFFNEEFAS